MVVMPEDAFFVVVPSNVPGPDKVKVRAFVAVVTALLLLSATLDVTSEVALPSASMPVGSAVLMTFAGGPNVAVTATELWLRFVPVVVTIAVPGAVWDCNVTVAMPVAAFFVVAPSSVPCPDTVNVRAFVAVATVLLFASATLDVIKAVALPSAIMLVLSAVFMTFAGVPNVVVTSTALWARFEAVAVTVAVPMAVMDCKVIVAMPLDAFFVVVPSNVP